MGRADSPELEITLQTRGLQWGCEWDISRLLALGKRYSALKVRYTEGQDTGQAKLFFTCGKHNAQKDKFAAAIQSALSVTPCVLSIEGRNAFRHITHRSRRMPSEISDVMATQPEFGAEFEDGHYPYDESTSWRSACAVCPKVHDRKHACCRLAASQPATSGAHGARRMKLSEGCILERFKTVQWPVPGSLEFRPVIGEWYPAARFLGMLERNNELKRRVDAAVFRILPTAKILLRATKARLPPELLLQILEETYIPALTRAQFNRLLTHAADEDETRAVAKVLCAAARERTPRSTPAVFGENRRIALRDEWLWNGGFVYDRSYFSAQRELGMKLPRGSVGRWPFMENREEVLRYLGFGPMSYAAWPYDDDGNRIEVTPHSDPDIFPPFPEGRDGLTVFITIEVWAPFRSNDLYDSEPEEPCLWHDPRNDGLSEAGDGREDEPEDGME